MEWRRATIARLTTKILLVLCLFLITAGAFVAGSSSANAASSAFLKNHQLYDRGEDIRSLQQFFNTHDFIVAHSGPGSPGNETSFFGLATFQALNAFQSAHGLPSTGYFGPLTRAVINSGDVASSTVIQTAAPTTTFPTGAVFTHALTEGQSGADVTELQHVLIQQGFLGAGNDTGYFGPLTAKAVAAFQAAHNIDPLGGVGPLTRAVLNALLPTVASSQNIPSTNSVTTATTTKTTTATTTPGTVTQPVAPGNGYTPGFGGGGGGGSAATPAADTAPVLSSISPGTPVQTSATITWTTDKNADSKVVYGLTTSYGSTSSSTNLTTSHSISISGLVNAATYHYAVVSTDASGNAATSTDQTFTTMSFGGNPAASTWQQLQVGAGGFLTSMSIANDGTMVVRTDTYGVYLYDGAQWQQLVNANSMPAAFVARAQLFNYGVFDIQVAPSNSSVMYMAYPVELASYPPLLGVYKSTNRGATWTQTSFAPLSQTSLSQGPYRTWDQKMAVDPANPNIVYLGTGADGLFVTSDGGNTWSSVSGVPVATSTGGNYPGITGILFDPASTTIIYAASYGNGIYQTTNGGTSWSNIGGGGPSSVKFAAISSSGTDGTYYAVDNNNSLWVYANGTWTGVPLVGQDQALSGVAVDPSNPNHVVVAESNGQLDESFNSGGSWGGWSDNTYGAPNLVANDIPYQTLLGIGGNGLHFDQVIPGKLYINGDRSFWTTTLSGNIATSTVPTWTDQGLGVEQLVANEIIVPPVANSAPLLASWDSAVFEPTPSAYPSTIYPDSSLAAGWSIDYASSNPNFIALLADGSYGGGPQKSSYSTNDGQTWTAFPTTPYGTYGGDIAASTPSNIIFDGAGQQPYYTLDGGNTWNAVNLPGVSSYGSLVGAFQDAQVIAADRVLANTFYLLDRGTGLFKTTDGGATWTLVNTSVNTLDPSYLTGSAKFESTPGVAGDLWLASGPNGNAGDQGNYGSLLHSTDGGMTWTAIPNIVEPYAVGFGAPAPGQSYPAVYTVGWLNTTSTSSVTVGTGAQTFTVQANLGYQAGDSMLITAGSNSMTGTVTSYNSSTGSLVVNVVSTTGSGTYANWTHQVFGVWESDNEGTTWKGLGQWPFNSLDLVKTISGDPNVYGKVYVGFAGSGYAYYSSDGPHLRTIAFSPSSGTEILGSTTVLTLGLSEPVTVTGGTPTLTLNDGGTATYVSGSGTSALNFNYTVSSGQSTPSLTTTAINLNGATVQDSVDNTASLSLSGIVQSGPTISGTAPVISSIASSTASTTATVTWTTDQNSNSQVVYGTTTSYGSTSSSASLVTSHSISLSGLTSSTIYHFVVVSTNGAGQTSTSTDQILTTSP
ncbi:peptidoglycan-binding protein [Bradyrhizobium sp.]|uniref:peptidoglycan-binding protein n=1 Tax=Bradyrhizobium sp. TaxID=376 RepID=UPI003C72DCFA